MAGERNRILELSKYISSFGIDVNIGTTKARGNKGFFTQKQGKFRIDISKNTDSNSRIAVLLHEFAHFVHYNYDKNLKSLDFIFNNCSDDIKEELINVTVQTVPKSFAKELYSKKTELSTNIKAISNTIKLIYPEFKPAGKNTKIENKIQFPYKYLINYDRVKYLNSIYSIDNIEEYNLTDIQKLYIKLKSAQRGIRRVNSRINRLNQYYKNPTELFARFVELYYTEPQKALKIAPNSYRLMKQTNIPEFANLEKILNN